MSRTVELLVIAGLIGGLALLGLVAWQYWLNRKAGKQ